MQYDGPVTSVNSSLTLLPGALASNTTYQLMVHLINRQNPSLQSTGYLLVRVEDANTAMIVVG